MQQRMFLGVVLQVGYRIEGAPRCLVEAAAASGFCHASGEALDGVLCEIGAQQFRLFHEKVRAVIQAHKEEWRWSQVDVAKALMLVLPGCKAKKQPRQQPSGDAPREMPQLEWAELMALQSALEEGDELDPPSAEGGALQDAEDREPLALFEALDVASQPPADHKKRKRSGGPGLRGAAAGNAIVAIDAAPERASSGRWGKLRAAVAGPLDLSTSDDDLDLRRTVHDLDMDLDSVVADVDEGGRGADPFDCSLDGTDLLGAGCDVVSPSRLDEAEPGAGAEGAAPLRAGAAVAGSAAGELTPADLCGLPGLERDPSEAPARPSPGRPDSSSPARFVCGPNHLGYLRDRRFGQYYIARVTVFGGNTAVKCYVHQHCSLAFAEWKLPKLQDLRCWAAEAERVDVRAEPAAKAVARDAHVAALRRLRDQAVWPGRTRQSLVDEASRFDS